MNPCDYCTKVSEAQQNGEIRGWLAGLRHKEHCTGDEFCPCTLLLKPAKKEPVEKDPEDTPLIDLTEKT